MNSFALVFIILIYLAMIFYIAFLAEKKRQSKWVNNPYIYTLSLAAYCTAWTYYGSIGTAATSGIDFLTIYLGPMIALPLWIILMRQIIRISKQHNVTSIADFISLRYGKHRGLGAIVTGVCLLATIPYIALQLKAISDTFNYMSDGAIQPHNNIFYDSAFYIALILALFATFFGTQVSDATAKHRGIVASVALESILKLVFFLVVGSYITFYLFNGPQDIFNQAKTMPGFNELIQFGGMENSFNWMFLILLSFMAIFLLPRQFQVAVVENVRERHLKTAIWLFPLYLLLFNIFVIFIAWSGNVTFGDTQHAEYYSLLLPLENGNTFLALLVFLGGFSAVISMVVVSTLALSTMVSNNLIIPYGFLRQFSKNQNEKNNQWIKNIRRFAIFLIIALAYMFFVSFRVQIPLISIGLIAFVIVAQLGPSFFVGLFWNRGSANASMIGIIVGVVITVYTFVLPFSVEAFTGSSNFTDFGPFGIKVLKPQALFGLDFLDPPAHAFFWSLTLNTLCYFTFSLTSKGNYRERNYAEMFIDSKNFSKLQDSALVWKGEAYVADIKSVLQKFLGVAKTNRALNIFFRKYNLPADTQVADARLINFSEKLLAGSIGGASAKILISSVVKEEEISLIEVLQILEESKQTIENNKVLRDQSDELMNLTDQLKSANDELLEKDKQKDEFLDTVAHELKTPITGIRASTELLIDDLDEMPEDIRAQFLKNILNDSERISRLINNILDYEKLSTGREKICLEDHEIGQTVDKAIQSIRQMAKKSNCHLVKLTHEKITARYDEDRILQVILNLLSNAVKYADKEKGIIEINYWVKDEYLHFEVIDNGKGVPDEDVKLIFEKFYQSQNQNTVKPTGSGFGLAICKQIIEKHNGEIWYETSASGGSQFMFYIPKNLNAEENNGEENSNR